jgi:hypothetical protein
MQMTANKYKNHKTKVSNGHIADSRKEARRYEELLLLQKAGRISDLCTQVPYELIPAQYETYERYGKNGKRLIDGKKLVERACNYIADFVYTEVETGKTIVEDVKGVRTKEFVIKRKLMYAVYGIKVTEV